ncbi:transcriptional regulator, LuxR family [Rhodopseudomonas palustris HaA2]|uniref:Transcriptional regulator, LuxR family n=1 Tax=Rhodopseudomonas palustris (strain HaA2) TaxID=316058 RepID=Q2IUU3_RHOP2|nr:LuxR family transcriptional regulator [Rhodopseudomonas palustris]ABD08017.1 transcriptional regulator, LuxR family [Rhodopseudomonas palustris HaA2]
MSRGALEDTLTFVAALDRANTPDIVADKLLGVVRPFGYSQVLAGIIPTPRTSVKQQIANVVLHRWPLRWSERYFSRGYLFEDPTIRRVSTSSEPFVWSELQVGPDARANEIMREAGEFGLGCGFTVPMITLDGQSAGLSIAGDRAELPPSHRGMVQLVAMYAFLRSLKLGEKPTPAITLTKREADVLHWIAEGKTDWEISKILRVSEHLVDKMARQIRTKLGAVNRIQAVALAMRSGIIR